MGGEDDGEVRYQSSRKNFVVGGEDRPKLGDGRSRGQWKVLTAVGDTERV